MQLYDVPAGTLATWGFLINRRLKTLICMTCQAVVLPSHAPTHITRQHKACQISINKVLLNTIVQQEGLSTSWPELTTVNPVEFEGLERVWGYGCPDCPTMFQNSRTVVEHVQTVHQHSVAPADLPRSYMQRLSQAPGTRSWFSVTSGATQLHSPSANYLLTLRHELDIRPLLPATELDHRHISPWHITTRWIQYMKDKDPVHMLAVIELPKEGDPLFALIICVRHYIEAAYGLIPHTSEVCLQILHTETMTE